MDELLQEMRENIQILMETAEVLVCDVDKVMADCRQSAQELADDINGGK